MLENPTPAPAPAALPIPADSSATVKRYAPPNQRNRSINRRKSGEKNQHVPSRTASGLDHFDVGGGNPLNENSRPCLVALEGCSRSEVAQLLNDRWALAMHNYNDTSVDLSERPLMYSGNSAAAWGHFKLPHQFMPQANSGGPSSGPQMDFLSELRRAMRSANANPDH
ncbi:uncharacterized protein LOC126655371 isoform X2 [Mercurialis annua]|uniref:uncharacterized protein LOC126655371 isoform X2 n=1 Tax=Mercurialis annua TaxID=3986 RepID=UPI0021600F14|nr:uncharacterized protein LOC126655371 isoform X2 [Mercurialis annua]